MNATGFWRAISCDLSSAELQEALASVDPAPTRSAFSSQPRDVLLISDMILAGSSLVGLNVIANRDSLDPRAMFIEAFLVFEQDEPRDLRATLKLGGQEWSTPVDDGHAVFPSLPIDLVINLSSGKARTDLHLSISRSQ